MKMKRVDPFRWAKEPRQFRTPEKKHDGKVWKYRSTWVLRMGAWHQVEDHVQWDNLDNPREVIKPSAEKGIFRFECDLDNGKKAKVAAVTTVANDHEHQHPVPDGRKCNIGAMDNELLSDFLLSYPWPEIRHPNEAKPVKDSDGGKRGGTLRCS